MSRYRCLDGKFIYLTVTRPDIAYVVGVVSQFMTKPRQYHLDAVMKILEYFKGLPSKGLLFNNNGYLKIEAYSNVSYANDRGNRKSTSGSCTFLDGNIVTWRNKKQFVIVRSSVEVEYRGMAQTT